MPMPSVAATSRALEPRDAAAQERCRHPHRSRRGRRPTDTAPPSSFTLGRSPRVRQGRRMRRLRARARQTKRIPNATRGDRFAWRCGPERPRRRKRLLTATSPWWQRLTVRTDKASVERTWLLATPRLRSATSRVPVNAQPADSNEACGLGPWHVGCCFASLTWTNLLLDYLMRRLRGFAGVALRSVLASC